jgi:hypothetical protein
MLSVLGGQQVESQVRLLLSKLGLVGGRVRDVVVVDRAQLLRLSLRKEDMGSQLVRMLEQWKRICLHKR